MKHFCILIAFGVISSTFALPIAIQNGSIDQVPLEVSYDDIIDQTVITVAQIQLAFLSTYEQLEAALSEAKHAEVYARARLLIEGAEAEAANIFSKALENATPDTPLEDLAVVVMNTMGQLGLTFVHAVTEVEQLVETEAPETLPQIHQIILGLAAEIEFSVKPLLELISSLLPLNQF